MKFLFKKIYIILFLLIIILTSNKTLAIDVQIQYKRENISNYFSGIVSVNQDYNNRAFDHLKKVQSIKNKHSQFNVEFIRTLVLLEKFNEAFTFSKSTWIENELFFETDLLLGLNSFINKDFVKAEKYFQRLNKISRYNLVFDNFMGNVLIAWSKAAQGYEDESFDFLKKIPDTYSNLEKTQNIFLQCYFDSDIFQNSMQNLIEIGDYNFSRYNYFLINYLLYNNKKDEAEKIIQKSRKNHNSNLLLKQTENFFLNGEISKIKNFYNCKKPRDSLAEFFYVIANLYASEDEYLISNFYLKISHFLNNKFLPNKALLAENYFYQKKLIDSKKNYNSIKAIGPIYSWYASKNISAILLEEKDKEAAIKSLERDFDLLSNPTYEHYYELANFYKENEYYEKSIKYYSLALEKIKKDHILLPKILDRRGTSYERIGDWENAEKDLTASLKILPDQAHVLNYLAYTWIDQGINLDKGLEMLKKATELRKNDGYIIDSLGWAYFVKKNYDKAEFFLQKAVQLLPLDPIINDHYADALWMMNKDIQARHVWNNILKLSNTEKEFKDTIKKKLLFGITRKL